MDNKRFMETFISDIEKIVTREPVIPSEHDDCDKEYNELLFLAHILAKADYTPDSRDRTEKINKMTTNTRNCGEMEDDELDMVAGGVNLNEQTNEKGKKDGFKI